MRTSAVPSPSAAPALGALFGLVVFAVTAGSRSSPSPPASTRPGRSSFSTSAPHRSSGYSSSTTRFSRSASSFSRGPTGRRGCRTHHEDLVALHRLAFVVVERSRSGPHSTHKQNRASSYRYLLPAILLRITFYKSNHHRLHYPASNRPLTSSTPLARTSRCHPYGLEELPVARTQT